MAGTTGGTSRGAGIGARKTALRPVGVRDERKELWCVSCLAPRREHGVWRMVFVVFPAVVLPEENLDAMPRALCWNHDSSFMDAEWRHLAPAPLIWHHQWNPSGILVSADHVISRPQVLHWTLLRIKPTSYRKCMAIASSLNRYVRKRLFGPPSSFNIWRAYENHGTNGLTTFLHTHTHTHTHTHKPTMTDLGFTGCPLHYGYFIKMRWVGWTEYTWSENLKKRKRSEWSRWSTAATHVFVSDRLEPILCSVSIMRHIHEWPGKRNWLTWSVGHLITLKVVPLELHTLLPAVPPLLEACRKSLFRNGV
jgi:hypothetical protein